MNLNAHILRLMKIREKMERGEDLSEREVAYVKALWARIKPAIEKLGKDLVRISGISLENLSKQIERESLHRQRVRQAQRDAMQDALMRRWWP